ncbi:MAG TPA: hypothetical protein VIY73_04680, partial [Polyangiaceae bacterium]
MDAVGAGRAEGAVDGERCVPRAIGALAAAVGAGCLALADGAAALAEGSGVSDSIEPAGTGLDESATTGCVGGGKGDEGNALLPAPPVPRVPTTTPAAPRIAAATA